MRNFIKTFGLCFLFAFAACAHLERGEDGTGEGDDDAGPPDGGACMGENCPPHDGGTPPECDDDGDCPEDQICTDGTCETPPECTDDGDCGCGESCVEGACEQTACCRDSDCPDGDVCDDGDCGPPDQCSCDNDCGCGEDCIDGACVQTSCCSDADCPEGKECRYGHCVCDGDDDDGEDHSCHAGKTLLCHYPPGNPSNRHEICVGNPAVPAHQAHGDTLGDCP